MTITPARIPSTTQMRFMDRSSWKDYLLEDSLPKPDFGRVMIGLSFLNQMGFFPTKR